jgi:predicted transposase YbfD/YdcC
MSPSSASLFTHLLSITDPRREASTEHPLASILFIAVCAVLCGADGWSSIARWGEAKREWLESFLDISQGIPSHDTFSRVFSLLSPNAFATAFLAWMQEAQRLTEGEVLAIDGKALRRSRCKSTSQAAIHMVSVFATSQGMVLGQIKTEEKSNEITAIPALLEMLEVRGCLVSLDAMGCQKAIVEKIVEKGGDYLISVKENQPTLRSIVEEEVSWSRSEGLEEVGGSYAQHEEKRAGEQIRREVWMVPAPLDLIELEPWKGLHSFVFAQRTVFKGGKEVVGQRFFISSLPPEKAARALSAVRQHWAIENKLHWSLDVAFDEDQSRIRTRNAAENMARLRHIALNLLKKETSAKVGIAIKRSMAGWSNDYLLKVLSQ